MVPDVDANEGSMGEERILVDNSPDEALCVGGQAWYNN